MIYLYHATCIKLLLQYQLTVYFIKYFLLHTHKHICCSSLNLYFLSFSSIRHSFTWLFPHFGDRELYLVSGCLHHAPHTGLVRQADGWTRGVFKHRDKTLGQDGLAVTQFCPDLDLHFLKNPSHTKYFILWNTDRFINQYAKFTYRCNLKIIEPCPTLSNMHSSVLTDLFHANMK